MADRNKLLEYMNGRLPMQDTQLTLVGNDQQYLQGVPGVEAWARQRGLTPEYAMRELMRAKNGFGTRHGYPPPHNEYMIPGSHIPRQYPHQETPLTYRAPLQGQDKINLEAAEDHARAAADRVNRRWGLPPGTTGID